MSNFKKVKFHIKSDDFHSTLATVVDLVRQDLHLYNHRDERKILEEARDDLLYVQDNYKLVKRKKNGNEKREN